MTVLNSLEKLSNLYYMHVRIEGLLYSKAHARKLVFERNYERFKKDILLNLIHSLDFYKL